VARDYRRELTWVGDVGNVTGADVGMALRMRKHTLETIQHWSEQWRALIT
jgi:hypothetical protein